MTAHHDGPAPARSLSALDAPVSLRGAAELADALPYLLGFHPDDSIVLAALHGEGQFGGRLRVGIPPDPREWPAVADQLAECLAGGAVSRGARPDAAVLFLCQEPAPDTGADDSTVVERLRPLAQALRTACGHREVPVYEALCVSEGRYWSYCRPQPEHWQAEGTPLTVPGTSAMAAAATYAGIRVRGSIKEMTARLAPLTPPLRAPQRSALDAATMTLLPRMLDVRDRVAVAEETLALVRRLLDRFRAEPLRGRAEGTPSDAREDGHDDTLLPPEDAARVILGLQDRETRDLAARWMEGGDALPALRLWRALARRCVGPYGEHSAPPLTLAGWVAWASGDEVFAQVAFGRALEADPHYLFAQLLHRACNEGLDPELLRRCLRQGRLGTGEAETGWGTEVARPAAAGP